MSTFYIASRVEHADMTKILGEPARRLNQSMSKTLRNIAMKQGIAKTSKGSRLEFYAVDKDELNKLTAPASATVVALKLNINWRPLLTVDAEKMSAGITAVNSKYPSRMPRDIHKQYLADLETAVEDSVVKIAEDTKAQRPVHSNPGIKVGDWLTHNEYRGHLPARVIKVTEKSFTYEIYAFKGSMRNPDRFSDEEKKQRGIVFTGDGYDGSIRVPYKGNKDLFAPVSKKTKRFSDNQIRIYAEDKVDFHDYWYQD